MMKFPSIFVNHGGGPLPLLGRQPELVTNMQDIVQKHLVPNYPKPKAIVMLSAHWESNPIRITSSPHPSMYYDYGGFPPESYKYEYPAPGSPALAQKIQNLLGDSGIASELDDQRGFDHGIFVPLMIMYPEADIPVVCVSLHDSLSAEKNMAIGKALAPLREEGDVLLVGSGYTFHNMNAFFHPSNKTVQASKDFNEWLKDTLLNSKSDEECYNKLLKWDTAPGARMSHPREEHLLPLLMVAASSFATDENEQSCKRDENRNTTQLIFDTTSVSGFSQLTGGADHAVTGYLFQ